MADEHETFATSLSLLDRATKRETDAWNRLVRIYSPLVYHWAIKESHLSPEDAADIVQAVFVAVSRGLEGFRHDQPGGTFRGWLRVITRNKIRDLVRRRQRDVAPVGGSTFHERIQELPEVDEELPASERVLILREVLQLIQADFKPTTWSIFERSVLKEHSTADIASDLGMTEFAVRQACYRVRRRLKAEMTGLMELSDDEPIPPPTE